MNRDEAMTRSDEALKELVNALKQGKSDSLVEYLDMLARFHRYSFGNCMLIALQKPDATLVAGFQRWKELHRWVKKGEHGICILAPIVAKRKGSADDGNDVEDINMPTKRVVCGFRVVRVFDVSQTEGKELPEIGRISGEPGARNERLEKFIRAKGIELVIVDSLGGALGLSHGGKISILSTLGPAERFATLVHELGHELLHRGDRRKETTKAIRETEAEAVAYIVGKASGLAMSTHSVDYIHLWSGDESVLLQSLELVRSVASQILTAVETPLSEPAECAA